EIALQEKAYNAYMAKANATGLSNSYQRKIQNGTLQLEDITNETLKEQISSYQEYYEKALKCSDSVRELKTSLSELEQQKFNNLQSEFESYLSTITAYGNILDERISRAVEQGYFVSGNYYTQLISYEKQELARLQSEYAKLNEAFNQSVASGAVEKGSEAWNTMYQSILDVQKSIEESTTALVEYNNKIRDLDWEIFDYILERIDKINDEADFMIDILSDRQLHDDSGNLSGFGLTTASLTLSKLSTYTQMAKEYGEEIKQLDADLANDPNSKTLLERREKLIELQQEAIQNARSEKDSIKSLVKEGIQIHLDALNELIDKYKNSLDAAKDLYEYRNNISEQTAEISRLQKILLAYEGDDSESMRKTRQEYEAQLEEARKHLKETEWDKYISETETLLDTLYTDYEEILNARLDDIDSLIENVCLAVDENSAEIQNTLFETAESLGYEISAALTSVYGSGNVGTTFRPYFDGVISAINAIKALVENMSSSGEDTKITAAGTSATATAAATGAASGSAASGSGKTSASASSAAKAGPQGDGKADKGDRVTFDNGKYYEDSYGNGRSGSYHIGEQVYITAVNSKGTYPYHISKGASLGSDDLGWVKLSQLKGYRTGSRRIPQNQWAWTQEDGTEITYRAADGAMLVPLGENDMVFTSEMSRNLWKLAQGNLPNGMIHANYQAPDITVSRVGGTVNNQNSISITLPNVTNYEEFKAGLQKDKRFTGFIQEVTLGQALGRNSLNRNKY
ncbi:MAG: hypothetical protein ACI39R_09425, partial [Lachnospiraceae bacterium]